MRSQLIAAWITWACVIVLIAIQARVVFWLVRGFRADQTAARDGWCLDAQHILANCPSPEKAATRLWAAGVEVEGPLIGRAGSLPGLIDSIARVAQDPLIYDEHARKLVEDVLDMTNPTICEWIDDGLIHPRHLFARESGDAKLVTLLALIEPFVWYESLVEGRGRWGYRPIFLGALARRYRTSTLASPARHALTLDLSIDGRPRRLLVAERVEGWELARGLLVARFRSRTITARTKRRQERQARRIRSALASRGISCLGRSGQAW